MAWSFKRISDRFSGPMKGVAAIASASFFGQFILAASTPILSRIYPPESFGVFSFILAIASVVGPAATLKLEAALLLPSREDDARRLFRLGLMSSAIVSIMAAVGTWIAASVDGPQWAGLQWAPAWVAVMVFATSTFAVLSQGALRSRKYSVVAKRSITQATGTVAGQLGLGLLTQGPIGLLGGFMIGRCAGYVPLLRATRPLFLRPIEGSYKDVLRRFWRFPAVFMPSGLLNALGTQLPLILIVIWFGTSSGGELGIAQRLVFIPMTLIGASVSEVFGAEISQHLRQGRTRSRALYLKTSLRMAAIAFLITLILFFIAPWLLPLILGDLWLNTGLYAQAMAISVGFGLVASPLSRVFIVYQESFASIVVDLSRIALIVGSAFIVTGLALGPIEATWVLYSAQSINYAITWLYGLRIVSKGPNIPR